jgi:type II secretory ATPase GspE/PulE/Tfp pilus assembly ATPase PilB-like protein
MHTVDAASAVTRLLDLGVEPYKIASTLKLALAQRLVRKICQSCKEHVSAPDGGTWRGRGCPACRESGYKGRTGIFEFIGAGDELKEMVMSRRPAHAIREHAATLGLATLCDDGFRKAADGVTTREEVERVTRNIH